MVQRIGGFRRKTRGKLSKDVKGYSIRQYLQTFEDGETVGLKLEAARQKGMYHPRFHGKMGIIKSKEGSVYNVIIKDGNKTKLLKAHPIHLKKLK